MAVRIRVDGQIVCAAMHKAEVGDTYLDDTVHYYLSCERKLLVSERAEDHVKTGLWWWQGAIPEGVLIDPFYAEVLTQETSR